MKPLLIALHGLPGVGKDAFANRLIEHGNWSKISFAAPLKRGLSTMLNIPMEDIENPSLKNAQNYKFNRSIRYMLQTLGTEWGRDLIDEDIWLKLAVEGINHQFTQGMNVINTDLRFPNESAIIKKMGGYVIHILRDTNIDGDVSMKTGVTSHQSNAGIPREHIDYIIHNNSTLSAFEDAATRIINEIAMGCK